MKSSLATIRKSFGRPHSEYSDIIFDQVFDNSLHQQMESIQYNAAAITGVIGGTLKDRFYKELSFESLQSRRWFQKSLFYKMIKKRSSTLFLN